ncbi:LCP family protein [Effusibacillus dendaii]|uniref:Cell envelope-related transcriptional attenuator domain-containing protein n=1 Tax=Effusibacillus dendaii TaxID=2743772 RepID=A0A7I8D9Z8_9BACL|nr:LCP family protein [Effusibacillus dendaii]BCJ86192.1 hypothetical protein skT53_11770 [Effusibacillus dendaii]
MEKRKQTRTKKRSRTMRGLLYTVLFFMVMVLAGAGYYAYSFYSFARDISTPSDKLAATDSWTGTERVNILLLGVDARAGDLHPRSDTMMLVSIDPQTKKASLFSIMRDTYFDIPGYGRRKINEANALGGPDLAVKTVSNYLQLPVHYYVQTDFNGFADIVDELGGVDLYVDEDMYWYDDGIHDINLKKGQQHLDGKKALMYVRFRHDAQSDYGRTERQRTLLKAVASKMESTNSLVKLPEILDSIKGDIKTNMMLSDMLKLGSLAYSINASQIDSIQLPPLHDSTNTKLALFETTRGGADVIIPDVYETRLLVHKTLNDGKLVVRNPADQEPMVDEAAPVQTATPASDANNQDGKLKNTKPIAEGNKTDPSKNGSSTGTGTTKQPSTGNGSTDKAPGTSPNTGGKTPPGSTGGTTGNDGRTTPNGSTPGSGTTPSGERRTPEPPTVSPSSNLTEKEPVLTSPNVVKPTS